MEAIRTERLTLRDMTFDDVETFVAYRSLPEVRELMETRIPPTIEDINEQVAGYIAEGGPTPGNWYRWVIDVDGTMVGDVVCQIRDGGGIAEIGYSLRPEFQGHGYAREAAGALVDHLMAEHGIHRIEAALSPLNIASMRVLESIGLTFEYHARMAFCMDGEWEDDLRYAMTDNERVAWKERKRTKPNVVELVTIEPDEAYLWGRLATHYSEQRFVSPMPLTFRDALFPEEFEGVTAAPWMRGILADGERAGFVMCSKTHGTSEGWYLWRLLIDRMHQRRSIAAIALRQLTDELRADGVPRLVTSYVEGRGTPLPFYLKQGFTQTGRIVDEEPELVLELS